MILGLYLTPAGFFVVVVVDSSPVLLPTPFIVILVQEWRIPIMCVMQFVGLRVAL